MTTPTKLKHLVVGTPQGVAGDLRKESRYAFNYSAHEQSCEISLTMALREQSDSGVPVVFSDPDDPAAQALHHAARGLIALSPIELPVMQAPSPAAAPKPAGMSLPMA